VLLMLAVGCLVAVAREGASDEATTWRSESSLLDERHWSTQPSSDAGETTHDPSSRLVSVQSGITRLLHSLLRPL